MGESIRKPVEKYWHLFQKMEDGLPEYEDFYIVLTMSKDAGIPRLEHLRFDTKIKMFRSNSVKRSNVFAWLNMEKLTTKDRAITFAKDCWQNYDIAFSDILADNIL